MSFKSLMDKMFGSKEVPATTETFKMDNTAASMYCFQCQEAAGGVACSKQVGVCGKTSEVANLQDLLLFVTKGIAYYNQIARAKGINNANTDQLIFDALFSTITNANFDEDVFNKKIETALEIRDIIKADLVKKGVKFENLHDSAVWTGNQSTFAEKATSVGILATENEDIRSLRELITYGLKGMAAYGMHALHLNKISVDVNVFIEEALVALTDDSLSVDDLVALTLKTGDFGVQVMALLDDANTSRFGNPELTEVNIGTRNKPAILISGHDLNDLEMLLEQTKGSGVDVYTHSEMLPAHYYPEFKKYDNLVGNYGNAWWKQKEEFESFNGPVLFTTNCIVPPKGKVQERIFTTGSSGFPGCTHIDAVDGKKDFTQIIAMAKTLPAPTSIEEGKIVGGFAHAQVFALADKVVDAVKTGAIKQFFVMAGCDGRQKGRDYYTDFAKAIPEDTVILTAGCAKYRYNKLNLGDIGGIPRVLDAGQCNDSYSLAIIALKLKEVFELEDINELPISYNIAWYEQKAVIVLLALLSLGVKNIHLGPTLPAFLSPNVANVLVNNFGIAGIGKVEDDIQLFLGN
jgi:hydroxylamine reductase